jgi:ABC-type phosphate transport system substrate-binding protein
MKRIIVAILLLIFVTCVHAQLVVIGNKANPDSLTAEQAEAIFMGRTQSLPNGHFALPMDQNALRPDFYQKLTHRPIEQIDAYWARIMFTGQATPPTLLSDDNAVLKMVKDNKDAIGYVDSKSVNNSVRVLLVLDSP